MSGRFKPVANTYVRPVEGWWKANPFYLWYMLREVTALFVTIYALVLFVGLVCLTLGEGAYNAWRAALATPASLVFHLILLLLVGYHTYTWFKVMPKTTPHTTIEPKVIVMTGCAVTAGLSVLIVAVLWGVAR